MNKGFDLCIRFGKDKKRLRIPGYHITESKDNFTFAIDNQGITYVITDTPKSWILHKVIDITGGGFQIQTSGMKEVHK